MTKKEKLKIFIFPAFLLFVYIILVVFRLHSSSIGMYHKYFYGDKKDPNLIFGQPRAIRSDEWLYGTPKVISQVKNNFKIKNDLIGYGEVMPIQACYPYKHWRVIFCPHVWFFFFLPLEYAFSASWWFMPFLSIIGVYFLFYLIFKKILLSIGLSLAIFLSPFMHWWSYFPSYQIGFISLFCFFFIKSISSNKLSTIFYTFFSVYFFICFLFLMYPPFQISSLFIFFPILVSFLIKNFFGKKIRTITIVILIFSISIFFINKFYNEFSEVIDIVRNTVYPGKRIAGDHVGDIIFFLNGFYNIQFLDDFKMVRQWGNQSSASNFFQLSFFCLPVYFWIVVNQFKKRKIDLTFLLLLISYLILTLWYFFPWPRILAKITLLYLVPQKRVLLGIGVLNYILIFYYLARLKIKNDSFYRFLIYYISFFTFIFHLWQGYLLKKYNPVFIQNDLKIFLISVISFLLVYLLLSKKNFLFLSLLLFFSLLTVYRVNPIYVGIDILNENKNYPEIRNLFINLKKITNKENFFVNYGPNYIQPLFLVNNLRVLDNLYYYPQYDIIKHFDSQKKFANIWNRYAHVDFYIDKVNQRFLLKGKDGYMVNIHPCEKSFLKLNVKYFIFDYKPPKTVCLNYLRTFRIGKINLYFYQNNQKN